MENIFIEYFKKYNIRLSETSQKNLKLITNISIEEFFSKPKKEIRYKWYCDYDGKFTSLNFVRKNSIKIPIEKICNICGTALDVRYLSDQISFMHSKNVETLKPSCHINRMCLNCAMSENSKNGLENRKKTCLEKYGVEYKILDPEVIKNREIVLKNKYGENYRSDFWKKAQKTYLKKYGVDHNTKIPEVLDRMIKTRLDTLKTLTKKQKDLWTTRRLISYKKEGSSGLFGRNDFDGNSKIAKDFITSLVDILQLKESEYEVEKCCLKYSIDFLIYDTAIIEFYGDFWHGNPEIYKNTDIIGLGSDKILTESRWIKDDIRIESLKEFLQLPAIIVWEKSYKENKEKIILDIVKNINILKDTNEKQTYIY